MVQSTWPQVERRRYPRVKVPVLYRLSKEESLYNLPVNMSLGGIRIFSNVYFKRGRRMEIELLLPGGHSVIAAVRVVWINVFPKDSDANFDVGLEFIQLPLGVFHKLKDVFDKNYPFEDRVSSVV